MRNVIVQLKPNRDVYPVDCISCFEKPLGIAVEGLQPQYGSLFYIFLKLMRGYCNGWNDADTVFQYTEEILPRLGLRLKTLPPPQDLVSAIKAEIDLQHPVLLPGNLRALFYSYHYMASDWEHLFLIKGYDEEKRLFFIMDGCQKKTEEYKYEELALPFQIVTGMYESYKAVYPEHEIFAIETSEQAPISQAALVLECIGFLESRLHREPYREIEAMSRSSSASPGTDSIGMPLFKIVKHKEVLYSELLKQIEEMAGDSPELEELQAAKTAMIGEWNLAVNNYLIHAARKRPFDIAGKTAAAVEADEQLRALLAAWAGRWRAGHPGEEGELAGSLYAMENNEDGIISHKDSGLVFAFPGDKLYNCWISDESPKAMLRETDFLQRDFHYSVEMEAFPCGANALFQAGLVFRTTSGELYYWGIINGESVMLSKIGDFRALSSTALKESSIILSIRRVGEEYRFGFSGKARPDEEQEPFATSGIGRIAQIGVGCKTWDKATPLRIEFSF